MLSSGAADPGTLLSGLLRAGDERRLLLWSAHPEEQALLASTTLGGGLPSSDDAQRRFGVYLNDGTGSKMDIYLRAEASLAWDECATSPAGTVGDATLAVTLTSDAPADAANLPPHVTGEGAFGVPPGTARTIVYVYLPEGIDLEEAVLSTGDGFGGGMHAGRRVLSYAVDLAPGGSATAEIRVRTATPGAAELAVAMTPTLQSPAPVTAACG